MGTSIRHILVDQDDTVIRLSNRLFQNLWGNSQAHTLPQFAGCRARWAEAVVELQDRKPVGILRVVFCYLYFDHQGRLDRDKVMKDAALMVEEAECPSQVVRLFHDYNWRSPPGLAAHHKLKGHVSHAPPG